MKKRNGEEDDVCYLINKRGFMIILNCGEKVVVIIGWVRSIYITKYME